MKVSKITIGRLYNLGNYEHVRYELTVEVPEGESAAVAVKGMERILEAMSPHMAVQSESELKRKAAEVERMKTMPAVEWERNYGGHKGTPTEIIERYQTGLDEETLKRQTALARAAKARQLFDDLGGAAEWKDAKLAWEDNDHDDDQY